MNERKVIYQPWVESEDGWGERPDGYSIHLTMEDRVEFIARYWRSMPSEIPNVYSKPWGNFQERFVDLNIYLRLQKARELDKYGLMFFGVLK